MAETMTSDETQTIARSARLPSTAPEGTKTIVAALANIGGAVSRSRLASHLGTQLTGRFSRALGSAILYGFVMIDEAKRVVISERGIAYVGADAEAAREAEREGIAGTGFGIVLKKLTTRAADEAVIALRLEEDLNVSARAAKDRAKLLVNAATEAGLVRNGNFDGGVIEDTFQMIGDPAARRVGDNGKKKVTKKTVAEPRPSGKLVVEATPGAGVPRAGSTVSEPRPKRSTTSVDEHPPRAADLPSATPESTKRIVKALADLAGPASRKRIAGRLNVKLAGRLISGIHAAILYGFITEDEEGKLVMTERGHAVIGDDENASREAQRYGIMASGFGATINQLRTHIADVEVVAVRLADDQGLNQASAAERAKVLVKAAADVHLIVNERFNADAIEDAVHKVGEPDPPSVTVKAKPKPKVDPSRSPTASGDRAAATPSERKEGGSVQKPTGPFEQAAPAPLQVVVQIDASKITAREIGDIVRELRATTTVSTAGF
jgi:hypothetical protein